MAYQVSDLTESIRIALNENATSTALLDLGDIETLQLDSIIESKIADAARIVESNAPLHLLGSGRAISNSSGSEVYTITWRSEVGYGAGSIPLPDDFLRLVCFQMSDWSMAVNVAIDENDPLYAVQQSRYPGLAGTPQKPVVAVSSRPTGLVLEFYTCRAGADVTVKRARYMPIPKITTEGEVKVIELPEKLLQAIIYYAAYMTAQTLGADQSLCDSLLSHSQSLMV